MGYNNNHAGLHMVRWNRAGFTYNLPDPYFYERTADEKKYPQEKKTVNKKPIGGPLKFDNETMREPKGDNRNMANLSNSQPKTKAQVSNAKKHKHYNVPQEQYGTELIIPVENLAKMDLVSRNVMRITLKKKLDISQIFAEAEDLMKRDLRTNPKEPDMNNFGLFPRLTSDVIFLSILASKMECQIGDFFIENEELHRDVAYSVLRSIDYDKWTSYDINSDGSASITIYGYDYTAGMAENFYYRPESMDLELTKEKFQDGTIWYSLSYGNLRVNKETARSYLLKGAYIFEEELGYLKDYMEKVLKECADKFEEWE